MSFLEKLDSVFESIDDRLHFSGKFVISDDVYVEYSLVPSSKMVELYQRHGIFKLENNLDFKVDLMAVAIYKIVIGDEQIDLSSVKEVKDESGSLVEVSEYVKSKISRLPSELVSNFYDSYNLLKLEIDLQIKVNFQEQRRVLEDNITDLVEKLGVDEETVNRVMSLYKKNSERARKMDSVVQDSKKDDSNNQSADSKKSSNEKSSISLDSDALDKTSPQLDTSRIKQNKRKTPSN